MACRGCGGGGGSGNQLCNCFTENSATSITKGNGSTHAPFTFRPNYVPFPRPFGHLYGRTDQPLDGAPYTLFEVFTGPDVDFGGNMNTGNRTTLIVPVGGDGLYLVGITVPYLTVSTDNLIDNFSLRRNGVQVSSGTWANNTTVHVMTAIMSVTTLLDLNSGDALDCFVERVAGAGNVDVNYLIAGTVTFHPHLWAVWMGGPI